MNRLLMVVGVVLLWTVNACAQQFTNVTDAQGIDVLSVGAIFGNGVSFHDFDQDGWDDLSIVPTNSPPIFYRNNEGTFEPFGFNLDPIIGDAKSILWVDFDNDGDKDLLTSARSGHLQLLENTGDLEFVDITEESGLFEAESDLYGCSWGDYNNDGLLDLYACKYHNPDFFSGYDYTNRLFKNNGDQTFTDVTLEAGVSNDIKASFQAVWIDYNYDGWQDIFVINDRLTTENHLYENNGDGTFSDVSNEKQLDFAMCSMTASIADYDHDNDLDIYITNNEFDGNKLFSNNGDEGNQYDQIATGTDLEMFETSWAALWIDYDLDMFQDLYVCAVGGTTGENPNYFFKQNTDHSFTDYTVDAGLTADIARSYTLALGDINNDGTSDFIQGCVNPSKVQLYQGTGNSNGFIKVSLEGTASNKEGIGSWIRVYANGIEQTRYSLCGTNYIGQDSQRMTFGLADATEIDSLKVEWLSGHVDTFYNLPINQTLHIIEGSTIDVTLVAEEGYNYCIGDSLLFSSPQSQSYLWSTGDTTQQIYISEPGDYNLIVYNEFGVPASTGVFSVIPYAPLIAEVEVEDVTCYDGTDGAVSINVDPIFEIEQITWSNGDQEFNIEDLESGSFIYWIEETNGCVTFEEIFVNQPDEFTYSEFVTEPSCFGFDDGTFFIEAEGGTPPYNFDWMGNDPENLSAGNYILIVSDSNACTTEINYQISEPDQLLIDLNWFGITDDSNGTAELEINGGTPPYSITWSNGEEDVFVVDDLFEGEMSVSVTDSLGCQNSAEFAITQLNEESVDVLSIYPNPFQSIIHFSKEPNNIIIRNSMGQLIYKSYLPKGSIKTESWRSGVYFIECEWNSSRHFFRLVKP